jgi:hypothetical protein
MTKLTYHLIHANVALSRAALDDEIMDGFVQQIEEINGIASSSPGFISQPTPEDAGVIYNGEWLLNMSVWDSIEHLDQFTHKGLHAVALDNRHRWFKEQIKPNYVLFWFEAGRIPRESEIQQRIDHLAKYGPTPYAFNFKHNFTTLELEKYEQSSKA